MKKRTMASLALLGVSAASLVVELYKLKQDSELKKRMTVLEDRADDLELDVFNLGEQTLTALLGIDARVDKSMTLHGVTVADIDLENICQDGNCPKCKHIEDIGLIPPCVDCSSHRSHFGGL